MALKDYYNSLADRTIPPKKEFREKIASACGVTEMTVFRWLSGEVVPDKLKREKIAEIANIPVQQLFPDHLEDK